MHRNRPRVAVVARTVIVAAAAAAALVACDTTSDRSPATHGMPATRPPIEPTPVSGNASVVQSPWGQIWDAIPPELLVFAGAQPVAIDEIVSAALDHPAEAASPADIANAYVTDLAVGGWRTALNGPLEDGSMVVDATRDGTACRAQVKATPLGGVVRITVLYGSECPKP